MEGVRSLAAPFFLLVLTLGCRAVAPGGLEGGTITAYQPFSHETFRPVLERFVNERGRVDYAGLTEDQLPLDRYYFLVSKYSPDSHPEFFPGEHDRLAYWINAYNVAVLKLVLAHYPITSVLDLGPPLPLFFLPRESGFFIFQRVIMGGKGRNLWHWENRVIRRRFREPRVHFALNCASRDCPRLARHPYVSARLDKQLDGAARTFCAEERNVQVDAEARTVHLSAIFEWFRGDFVDWYAKHHPEHEATLLRYVALYVPPERAQQLDAAAGYALHFRSYDWRLNAQKGKPRKDGG
jgi:hypothetical protein